MPCNAASASHLFAMYLRQGSAQVSTPTPHTVSAFGPMVLLSFDRRGYSRANWIGINPLTRTGAIEASARDTANGSTLNVSVKSLRIYYFPLLALCVGTVAAISGAPWPALVFLLGAVAVVTVLDLWLILRGIGHEFRKYAATAASNQRLERP